MGFGVFHIDFWGISGGFGGCLRKFEGYLSGFLGLFAACLVMRILFLGGIWYIFWGF